MAYITVGKENSADINVYYEDYGAGLPVILIHGWPLNGRSWEKQIPGLLSAGYRVIVYDRRGYGFSSQPATGHDYNTLARDLNTIITHLELSNVTLVGFSMGGGEIARYAGLFGSDNLRKAVFISAITPHLVKTPTDADGVDQAVFDQILTGLVEDRPAFLAKFFKDFYNVHLITPDHISSEAVKMSWQAAIPASPIATLANVTSWGEDFREDLRHLNKPTLVIHGNEDRIVPFKNSGERLAQFVPDCRTEVIDGAPHGLLWTHAPRINDLLFQFLAEAKVEAAAAR